jgi:hypothetical protein
VARQTCPPVRRKNTVKNHFNFKNMVMTYLSILLAINFGPGTIGLVLNLAE